MLDNNLEDKVAILADKSKHSKKEIMKMIDDVIEEMDNMVDQNGAFYVVAGNLGINVTVSKEKKIGIKDLSDGMANVTIVGRVAKIFPTNTFSRKDGSQGKVKNIELIDKDSSVRVAFWDNKVAELEIKEITNGSVIRLTNVNAKKGYQDKIELSLTGQSVIDLIKDKNLIQDFPEVEVASFALLKNLKNLNDGVDVSVKVKIVSKRESVTEFTKKDGSQGKVSSINIMDDGGKSRVTFWDDNTLKLEKLNVNDIIELTDLRLGSSDYGKELTFNSYSSIKNVEDKTLEKIEINENQELREVNNLGEIEDGERNLIVMGKIVLVGNKNSFDRDGETRYVGNLTIQDKSFQRRVTLWGNHAENIEKYKVDMIIKLENVSAKLSDYSKEIELSVGDYSTITDISESRKLDDYDREMKIVKLSDIKETSNGMSIKVKISRIYDVNTIERDGRTLEVLNMSFLDSEAMPGRIAAWNDNIGKISKYSEGDALLLKNVKITPAGEYDASVSINQNTTIEETDLEIEIPVFQTASELQNNPNSYVKTSLNSLSVASLVEVSGTIVKSYSPNFYMSCSDCRKKLNEYSENENKGICNDHGEMSGRWRLILSLVLDDGTDTVDIKIFDDVAERLIGLDALEAKMKMEELSDQNAATQKLVMKEFMVKGRVIEDTYGDEPKKVINVNEISMVDLSKKSDEFLSSFD